jgi:hypothetical protein
VKVLANLVVFLCACGSHERAPAQVHVDVAPIVSVAPTPVASVSIQNARKWPDEARATSRDGSFALRFPGGTFKPTSPDRTIVLTSAVSEPPWGAGGGSDIVFHIVLAKLDDVDLRHAIAKVIDPDSFKQAFSRDGSFKPIDGFLEEKITDGARGYTVNMGVEGTGDHIYAFKTKDGAAWRFDCFYCCGLIAKPKMTSSEQTATCDEVLTTFVREH